LTDAGAAALKGGEERVMLYGLHNWILIGSNAYDEYTFVPWLGKNVYRRTVGLDQICIQ
jgi:hypothetical protein